MAVSPPNPTGMGPDRIRLGDLRFDALPQREVVDAVRKAWAGGDGGTIIPVNVDVALAASRDPALARLVDRGSLVVADGMPLAWAARVAGLGLSERVAGSCLITALSEAAAADGKSLYLLGGAEGVPGKAAEELVARFPTLRIAGTQSPAFGFDATEEGTRQAVSAVVAAAPDLVFVGLGFPRQERLIERLRAELPGAWFLACGGGIAMAAGIVPRASPVLQRLGLEWVHRLALEPRRLARRYLWDDLPFALALLARSLAHRLRRGRPHGR
ncbi:WecB/TagA/CpsF family glycosyltransferase [Mycobacterium sp. Marseille-P9652]|uniref:WecB/TagA/CpsF family glycosyltransferase n=1 Tax=Mycobacterium sp. Marseille-P9652 TaxID=2654950 RepID=UPI001E5E94C6|nr:WecB/TagA/CpsF family glycosyltransferase [Mycobacterium sp. Marseille-P9652]